ncbi:unnamed protein product [Effrenium voratum]|uniref:Uncharacterized protein n=1 Tax=Effrenium voratum TaxID=2562239 RepID=A0AA36JAX6_9DINO|nr:unnamed protein product [Effrenium voratum]
MSRASTPSPEQMRCEAKEFTDSPGLAQRSIQNTPEPMHCGGAAISTPSPCAMSSLNHPMLGLPPLRRAFREAKLVV